ncbi:MAG: hypothetical protein IIB62_04245 [Proteobacteria bacterium]|nr:hypothetical protein [Pseudomonadota bacterium]
MMNKIKSMTKSRVVRHRSRMTAGGSRRLEVTVPSSDAVLVKAIAGALRSGGKNARRIREYLQPFLSASKAQTGAELAAFFRKSPLIESDLQIERDSSAGRSADFQ